MLRGSLSKRALQRLDEVQELHRIVVANVVQPIRGFTGPRRGLVGIPLRIAGSHFVAGPNHAFDDVVDVGEIAPHLPVVEHVNGTSFQNRFRKHEQRHVRTTPRAVHGEEPEPRRRQLIQMAVGVRHQLIGFFSGRVQRHGMVNILIDGKWHLGIGAVHTTRRRIRQVLHTVVPAPFKDVQKSGHVAVDVRMGIREGVTHPGLRGEMDDAIKTLRRKQLFDPRAIA